MIISNCERSEVAKLRNDPIQNVSLCLCVCVSVCLSVFYLPLDHWSELNEIFMGRRHQLFDGYYTILKTFCYYVN